MLVLEREGGHLALTAAIDQRYVFGREALGGIRGVDGGVAPADYYYAAAQRDAALGLVIGDEAERVDDAGQVFAGDVQGAGGAESDGEEDCGVVALDVFERDVASDGGSEAELDAEGADQVHFLEAVGGAQLVLGDSISVEAAAERARIENSDGIAAFAQFDGAG